MDYIDINLENRTHFDLVKCKGFEKTYNATRWEVWANVITGYYSNKTPIYMDVLVFTNPNRKPCVDFMKSWM